MIFPLSMIFPASMTSDSREPARRPLLLPGRLVILLVILAEWAGFRAHRSDALINLPAARIFRSLC
jgi:hypothetical protein